MTKKLFVEAGADQFYEDVRKETLVWHHSAKSYWQMLYEKNNQLLDKNFSSGLGEDFFSRLWELTQVEFLAQHHSSGLELIQLNGKNASKPDFCFVLKNNKFYLEAACCSPGNVKALNDQRLITKKVPIVENMERFCSAIDEKGNKKYHAGYKSYMNDDSGLILAISLAKIPPQNRTNNYANELRCIFGMSPLSFQSFKTAMVKEKWEMHIIQCN